MRKNFFTLMLIVVMILVMPMTLLAQVINPDNNQSSWLVHIVQPGESLWLIDRQYGVDVDTLKKINGLQSDEILKGQHLVIKPVNDSHSFFYHRVRSGDTPWTLSQAYNVSLNTLLAINGFRDTVILHIGDKVKIPTTYWIYIVNPGDTPWLISQRFTVSHRLLMDINNLGENSTIYPGQALKVPSSTQSSNVSEQRPPAQSPGTSGQNNPPVVSGEGANDGPAVTFTTHAVQRGDNFWRISIQHGIPMTELLSVNNMTERHQLQIGDVLTIPVHHIPVRSTVSPDHGELLDWWTEAQYVWSIGREATMIDFETGKSWNVIRTIGAFHADVEPLTAADTAIMREVWGGSWSWTARPVIIEVDGRRIAASANAMPHSIQEITGNNFNGHFCVHFLNSTRHRDNAQCATHQRNVRIAAGVN